MSLFTVKKADKELDDVFAKSVSHPARYLGRSTHTHSTPLLYLLGVVRLGSQTYPNPRSSVNLIDNSRVFHSF